MANVFGALNRFISRLDSDSPAPSTSHRNAFGFQILRNTNNDLNVEPWFDFVIGINGRQLDTADANLFASEVRNCAGSSVNLGLWSAKGQRIRSLYAPVAADTPALGLSLQWTPLSSTEDVWHILDVAPNSPADAAGLLPYGDYIIGSPEGLVRGESGLGELVEDYLTRPLRLFVYNHEYNVTRLVTIQPSRSWGGSGALGCVLGFGALHRIPASLEEPPQEPGETLFESGRLSTEDGPQESGTSQTPQYLVPAEIGLDTPSTTTSPAPGADDTAITSPPAAGQPAGSAPPRREKRQHHTAKAVDMDAYFAEGEAKSREQDQGYSKSKPAGLAPPPKGGGPPRAGSPLEAEARSGEAVHEEKS